MNKQRPSDVKLIDDAWDMTVDVLIVGSGFAGLTAAIEARQHGLDVLIIEKMKNVGGNSIISDGGIAAPDTHLQHKHGIIDSKELMYQDMLHAGMGLNHRDLLLTLVSHAKSAFEWTIDLLDVPYLDRVDIFGGHSIARCYTPEGVSGSTIITKMMNKIHQQNIPIKTSVSFRSFIQDDQGRVIGASLLDDYQYDTDQGTPLTIRTTKGVVLATGGYGADVVFRQMQDPRLSHDIQTTNKPFATAEALRAALDIGAASVQLSHIQLGAWASPDEKGFGAGPLFADYILFQHGLIIDPKTGKRFVNEMGDRKQTADAILSIGHPCIGIVDDHAVKKAGWDIQRALKKGVVKTFDTIEDISHHYEIDHDGLINTLNTFNQSIIKQHDPCYHKPISSDTKPITTPPYYVMRLWPKVHYTMGGVAINDRTQVLDFDGKPIEGLFAVGEVVGGVHGASRLGSCSITECIVFGRIAGSQIAQSS